MHDTAVKTIPKPNFSFRLGVVLVNDENILLHFICVCMKKTYFIFCAKTVQKDVQKAVQSKKNYAYC